MNVNFLDNNRLTFWPSDSNGHIEPDMKPLWHLGTVASSFVMLNQSTENTLYNMAQVANITQLVGRLICCWVRSWILIKTSYYLNELKSNLQGTQSMIHIQHSLQCMVDIHLQPVFLILDPFQTYKAGFA